MILMVESPPILTALDLAVLSEESYSWFNHQVDDNQLALTLTDLEAIFTPRGTEFDFEDIIRNMRAWPRRGRDLGLGHRGFQLGALALWEVIEAELAAAYASDRKVVFNGHSLGGALATYLAALSIVRGVGLPWALVTQGSPRCGIGGKLNDILEPISVKVRLVNGSDAVTDHPWTYWGYGYRHVDQLVEIGEPGHRWHDHRIGNYIDRLSDRDPIVII